LDADFRVEKCGHFKAIEEWATSVSNDREDPDAAIKVEGMPAHLTSKSELVSSACRAPAVDAF
jgi:hypothetical protein